MGNMNRLLPDPDVQPMVGLDVACRALDMSKNTAYALIRDGTFPVAVKRVGGTWKVSTAALIIYIASGSDSPASYAS